MQKKLAPVYVILAIFFAILISGTLFLIGFMIGPNNQTIYTYCFSIYFLFFIIYIVKNVKRSNRFKKELENTKSQEYIDIIDEKKEWVNNNRDKVRPTIYNIYHNTKKSYNMTMLIIVFGLIYSGICFKAIVKIEKLAPMASIIGPFVIFVGFISFFNLSLIYLKNKASLRQNKDFPLLNDFIKQFLEEEKIDKKFTSTILVCSTDCFINETSKLITFAIGDLLLKHLSLEEIKTILYHEIAHYKNEDTKYSIKVYKNKMLFNELQNFGLAFICPEIIKANFEVDLLETCSNIFYEKECDDYVLEKNLNKEFALANIKIFGMSLFANLNHLDLNYELTCSHQWTNDIIKKYYTNIYDEYERSKAFIDYCSKHHLEERIATHPNVRERRTKFYNDELDISLTENHYFDSDIKNAFKLFNKTINKKEDKFFQTIVEDYQARIKNLDHLEIEEIRGLLDNAMNLVDINNAITLANLVLKNDPNDLLANLALGVINSEYLFSEECIKYYQIVLEGNNSDYKLQALNLLGNYYVRIGNEEERNKLREMQATITDDFRDAQLAHELLPKDILLKYENDEINKQIIEIIKPLNYIEKVFCGIKTKENVSCVHYVFVCKNNIKYDKIKDDLNKINNYLLSQGIIYEMHFFIKDNIAIFKSLKNKELVIYKKGK